MSTIYHYIYETKNLINGRIYRGKHSTNNLEDGYLGSGKILANAIARYGEEHFEKSILAFANDSAELSKLEEQFVSVDWLISMGKKCYNLKPGGTGGWEIMDCDGTTKHIMNTASAKKKKEQTCQEIYGTKHQFHSNEFQTKLKQIFQTKFGAHCPLASTEIQNKIKKTINERYGVSNVFQIPEVKQKIRESKQRRRESGGKAANFGKMCYFNPENDSEYGFFSGQDAPSNWIKGNPATRLKKFRNSNTGEIKQFRKAPDNTWERINEYL